MKASRIILIVLELVVALNAVGGGIYGLAGAAGVPVALLRGSPFQSYFWPSLILLVVIGGSMLTAALLKVSPDITSTAGWKRKSTQRR